MMQATQNRTWPGACDCHVHIYDDAYPLIPNVPVLGINLRDSNKDVISAIASVTGPSNSNPAPTSAAPSSMTVQVSELDAEKIRLAEKNGTLSLTLRSINDRDNTSITEPVHVSNLTQVPAADQPQVQAHDDDSVKVIKR